MLPQRQQKFLTKLTQQKENDVSGYIKNLVVATDINKGFFADFSKLSGIKCNEKVILASRIIFAKGRRIYKEVYKNGQPKYLTDRQAEQLKQTWLKAIMIRYLYLLINLI